MTEIENEEAAQTTEESPEIESAENEPQDPVNEPQADADGKLAGEAASYRRKLRTAEGRIGELEEHIAELQVSVVGTLVEGRLQDPALFDRLVDREAWIGEDGRIDRAKLDSVIEGLIAEHPGLQRQKVGPPRGRPKPARGVTMGSESQGPSSTLDRAFPKAEKSAWQNLLERRPEADSAGDSVREKIRTRTIRGTIRGEDTGE